MTLARAVPLALLLAVIAPALAAGTVVTTGTVPARSVLGPGDVTLVERSVAGALTDPAAAIGLEARVILYAGRPVRAGDLGPPALIERNRIVTLRYRRGGLTITAEARALARAGAGETVRVMNLGSRNIVSGRVLGDGSVLVGARPRVER